MNGSFDVSTLVFAVLAVFVIWKLRSVLGTRTGTERPPYDPFAARRKMREEAAPASSDTGNVIRLPGADDRSAAPPPPGGTTADAQWSAVTAPGSSAAEGLARIGAADPSFTAESFMNGARAAYEMIVTAFAKGEPQTLAPLLGKDVFEGFAAAIAAREAQGLKVDTTFVGIDKAAVEDASLRGTVAQVVVRFHSKLITVTRDAKGDVVEGSPDQVSDVNDLWAFSRDVTARDPNWKLVGTETGG